MLKVKVEAIFDSIFKYSAAITRTLLEYKAAAEAPRHHTWIRERNNSFHDSRQQPNEKQSTSHQRLPQASYFPHNHCWSHGNSLCADHLVDQWHRIIDVTWPTDILITLMSPRCGGSGQVTCDLNDVARIQIRPNCMTSHSFDVNASARNFQTTKMTAYVRQVKLFNFNCTLKS